MKKNLLTVITFVLVLINLVLTGIITFVLVPYVNQANSLVTSVATAIDLEQKAGANEQSGGSGAYSIDQLEVYDLNTPDDKGMTINLKKGADGKDHYAVLKVSLSLNMESDSYKDYKESLESKKSLITNKINDVVSQHTIEEVRDDQKGLQDEILKAIQSLGAERLSSRLANVTLRIWQTSPKSPSLMIRRMFRRRPCQPLLTARKSISRWMN